MDILHRAAIVLDLHDISYLFSIDDSSINVYVDFTYVYPAFLKLDLCADRHAAFPALRVRVFLIHGIGLQASHHVGVCSGRLDARVAVGQTCLARIAWFRARNITTDEVAGIANVALIVKVSIRWNIRARFCFRWLASTTIGCDMKRHVIAAASVTSSIQSYIQRKMERKNEGK